MRRSEVKQLLRTATNVKVRKAAGPLAYAWVDGPSMTSVWLILEDSVFQPLSTSTASMTVRTNMPAEPTVSRAGNDKLAPSPRAVRQLEDTKSPVWAADLDMMDR